MPQPVRLAFLGCGFITRVHSGHLRALGGEIVPSYASRDTDKAAADESEAKQRERASFLRMIGTR